MLLLFLAVLGFRAVSGGWVKHVSGEGGGRVGGCRGWEWEGVLLVCRGMLLVLCKAAEGGLRLSSSDLWGCLGAKLGLRVSNWFRGSEGHQSEIREVHEGRFSATLRNYEGASGDWSCFRGSSGALKFLTPKHQLLNHASTRQPFLSKKPQTPLSSPLTVTRS